MDEITNYFLDRQTSGFVEGLNNKIKVIKRRCYGILNVKHLFQRIYLDLSGYAFEFIPIKSWVTKGAGAPGNCAGHSRVPSPDHGCPLSTGGAGLSQCDNA